MSEYRVASVLEEKKAKIVKRWTMDRNVSYMWLALLMDDNTLHVLKPDTDMEHIFQPVSTEPDPRKWKKDDGEAVILDDGNLLLHTDDNFAHAVYYLID